MANTKVKKVQKVKPVQSLTLVETQMTQRQIAVVSQPTPKEFIKQREGRGGKSVKYVEGGYVIARLNEAFSPLGWDFAIDKEEVADKYVWVRGTLTIIDHKNDYRVSKSTYGQHNRENNVPLGDTLKAASTDCLKKCASMLGIALDVYWKDGERAAGAAAKVEVKKDMTKEEMIANTLAAIAKSTNISLLQQWNEGVLESKKLNEKERTDLSSKINLRIDALLNASGQ